jgi:hypothetical protein
MIYSYPLRTHINQQLELEVSFEVKGFKLSIVEFNQDLKKLITGSTVKFYGPSAFTYDRKTDDVHTEAMASNHIIIFEYSSDNELLNRFKTYEFKNLINRISALIFNNGTHIIYTSNNDMKSFGSIRSNHRYLNRPYADLSKINLKDFIEISKICIEQFGSNKRNEALLSLFELSQLYGNPKGLRCSLLVTTLESLFAPSSPELKFKYSMRLTKHLKGDKELFTFFKTTYNKRSTYYHRGEDKFSHEEESKLIKIANEVIRQYIKDKNNIDIEKLDESMLDIK